MSDRVKISRDLKKWASTAGFSLTPAGRDGRTAFSNGETCYFIGEGGDDLLRVTASNRMGREQLEFAAPSPETIEKYLYGLFGPDIRYHRGLPQAKPVERPPGGDGSLPGGFHIRSLAEVSQEYLARFEAVNRDYLARFDAENQDYLAPSDDSNPDYLVLIDGRGRIAAIDGFDMVVARIRLFDLAVYLSHDTEEIKASFIARDGAPLLALIEGEGEGEPAPA